MTDRRPDLPLGAFTLRRDGDPEPALADARELVNAAGAFRILVEHLRRDVTGTRSAFLSFHVREAWRVAAKALGAPTT